MSRNTEETRTWTFQPDDDVRSLVKKELNRLRGRHGNKKGVRTRLINLALRQAFSKNAGKREMPLAA